MCGTAAAIGILAGTIAASTATSVGMSARGQHMQNKAAKSAKRAAEREQMAAKAASAGQARQPEIGKVDAESARLRGIQSTLMASRPTTNKLGA